MNRDVSQKVVAIVIPVFNDWAALNCLVGELNKQVSKVDYQIHLFVVDDCSSENQEIRTIDDDMENIAETRLIRLACNLGPMRAIAVGLVAAHNAGVDAAIVMDSDGEDQPNDVVKLISAWTVNPSKIVVAQRARRSESTFFKIFYSGYKFFFKLLCGQSIDFGSFSLLPKEALRALVHNPAIWNNLPAAIIRSRLPYNKLQTVRGARLAGRSGMNFINLAVHGVSAMSVYSDVVLLRIVVAMSIFALIVVAALCCVVAIKFGTDLAIPGWASYVAASLIIIFIQSLLFAGVALFQLLSFRNLRAFVPVSDAHVFVINDEPFYRSNIRLRI